MRVYAYACVCVHMYMFFLYMHARSVDNLQPTWGRAVGAGAEPRSISAWALPCALPWFLKNYIDYTVSYYVSYIIPDYIKLHHIAGYWGTYTICG